MEHLIKTPLYELHTAHNAKMVDYAGYALPVSYPSGIIQEHLNCRENASIFDVSHMGQVVIKADNAAQRLEQLIPIDVIDLAVGHHRYGFLLNDKGGIIDDLIVANRGEDYLVVVNGACKAKDLAFLSQHFTKEEMQLEDDKGLIALQGPKARSILNTLCPGVDSLFFMQGKHTQINAKPCYISCTGYTGEDGFEISASYDDLNEITRELLKHEGVALAGLGARDSLRIEAGLSLYGNDINEETTPIEANLNWAISKKRRQGGEREGGFIADSIILSQLQTLPTLKIHGFDVDGKAPIRAGQILIDDEGNEIGRISSGCHSPSIGKPIAIGYINRDYLKTKQPVWADVRGKRIALTPRALPFIQSNYLRG